MERSDGLVHVKKQSGLDDYMIARKVVDGGDGFLNITDDLGMTRVVSKERVISILGVTVGHIPGDKKK